MARDCPDRQRGTDWRNGAPPTGGMPGRPAAGRIGAGDAVDREYEQLMQELSGGAPDGSAPQRIEAGPGGYDQGAPDAGADVKPWQRGPTGGAAPWQQRGRGEDRDNFNSRDPAPGGAAPWARPDRGRGNDGPRGGDNYYGGQGFGGPQGGAAPWQQPPPQPNAQQAYGAYGGYQAPGYGNGYPPQPGMSAPPGLGGAPGSGLGAPPGLASMLHQAPYAGTPPPPPGVL